MTLIIRDGYLGQLNILHSDASNAFKRVETVVTIASTCTSAQLMGRAFVRRSADKSHGCQPDLSLEH